MKFLVDTNIFLEILLDQQSAEVAKGFLQKSDVHEHFISDFSLHSIAVILLRHKAFGVLERFLADVIISGNVGVLSILAEDLVQVIAAARRFSLDFDDAYQYVLAEQKDLAIISFDSDFDKTPRGRQQPHEVGL